MLACSPADRRRLYKISKRGFSFAERRDCWLLASGALQAIASASIDYYANLVDYCEFLLEIGYPT